MMKRIFFVAGLASLMATGGMAQNVSKGKVEVEQKGKGF